MVTNFKIKSNFITKELTDEQNRIIQSVNNCDKKVIGVNAPTGFGKTYVNLSIGKKFGKTLISVPYRKAIYDYFNANKILLYQKNSPKTGFLIGKGSKNPKMCPLINSENIEPTYEFCKREKKHCKFLRNMTYDNPENWHMIKPYVTNEIKKTLNDINSGLFDDFYDIIEYITSQKYCPHRFMLELIDKSSIKICDYHYLVSSFLSKLIGVEGREYSTIIDEYDSFEERLESRFESEISYNNIKKEIKKWRKKIDENIKKHKENENKPYRYFYSINVHFGRWLQQKNESCFLDIKEEKEKLIEANNAFDELKNDKECKEIFEEKLNSGKDETSKILRFLDSRRYINDVCEGTKTFVEFIEYKQQDDIVLKRILISFKSFFENKLKIFNKIIITSATLPDKDYLKKDFGEDIEVFKTNYKLGKRRTIIYKNPLFDLSSKNIDISFDKKVGALVDLIVEIKQNAIVVFYKSYTIIDNLSRRNSLEKKFREKGIPLFIVRDKKDDKEQDNCWNDFYSTCKKQKAVMMCSAWGKYGRSSNKLEGNKCRVLINWGKPVKPEPTFNPKLKTQIHKIYNDYFEKHNIFSTVKRLHRFNYFWYCIKSRRCIQQNVGRGVRGDNDYCFNIICMNQDITNVLPKTIQDDLDILQITQEKDEIIESLTAFFYEVKND